MLLRVRVKTNSFFTCLKKKKVKKIEPLIYKKVALYSL